MGYRREGKGFGSEATDGKADDRVRGHGIGVAGPDRRWRGAGVASAGTAVARSTELPGCSRPTTSGTHPSRIFRSPRRAHSGWPPWTLHRPTCSSSWGPTYGMPITVVPPSQPLVNITFGSSGNDPGPYPFSASTGIEGGQSATGDRHAIMVNPATCIDYELYDADYSPSGSTAANGAIWNLNSDALRPSTAATVDASGLPIVAGLTRYDEVASGAITHAIRVQAQDTDTSYIWPATAGEGSADNPNLPPMGARFRLKASFNISGYSPQAQVVLRALQQYGLILADNGPNWHFWGTSDSSWPLSVVQSSRRSRRAPSRQSTNRA